MSKMNKLNSVEKLKEIRIQLANKYIDIIKKQNDLNGIKVMNNIHNKIYIDGEPNIEIDKFKEQFEKIQKITPDVKFDIDDAYENFKMIDHLALDESLYEEIINIKNYYSDEQYETELFNILFNYVFFIEHKFKISQYYLNPHAMSKHGKSCIDEHYIIDTNYKEHINRRLNNNTINTLELRINRELGISDNNLLELYKVYRTALGYDYPQHDNVRQNMTQYLRSLS